MTKTPSASSSLFADRRGGSMVQTLILVSLVALGGLAAFKALGSAASDKADCAGKRVTALAAVPCSEGGEAGPGAVAEPPPAPEGDGPGGSDAEPEPEFDPQKELVQLALDIFGVTDAVKCFTEGDILACAMTVLALSPFKLISVVAKLAKNAKRIKQAVDKFLEFMAARRRGDRVADAGDTCTGGRCKNGKCFVAGTPVHTEKGWAPIETLKVGDLVLSRDDETGVEAYRPIAAVMITPDRPVLALALEDSMGTIETIEATPPHPFFVDGRGWVAASDLRPDDQVVGSAGGRLRVASTTAILRRTTVYNFEVADFHTYFVGNGAAWVHNDYEDEDPPRLPARDDAGKVHTRKPEDGRLPDVTELERYPTDELEQFKRELEESVQERIRSTTQHGPNSTPGQNRQHGQRQAQEQQLIKAIEKILRERRGRGR